MTAFARPPRRILVVPLRYIGDTVLTVPLVRNLKAAFPEAEIDMLVSRTTAPLMETCPYVARCIEEPKGTGQRMSLLKDGRYDAVFILRKSVTFALMAKLAGIPLVVGYDKQRFPFGYKRWGWFLDARARYPSLKTETPQAISHLGLLKAVGIPAEDSRLELWTTQADEQKIDALLEEFNLDPSRPMAVLHATSASHGKQIELVKFAESARQLQDAGFQLLTTGTQAEAPLYDELAQQENLSLINLAGRTSLRETVALYRRIQLLLTVDSSPVHLGAAAGVPHIVGVFGPTNEKQWGPHNAAVRFSPVFMDLPCRPCYAKVCEHNNCKVQLTARQIAEAVRQGIEAR